MTAAADPFARELAKTAIRTALETRAIVASIKPEPQRLRGLCCLCGAPVRKGPYCHAHSWAA